MGKSILTAVLVIAGLSSIEFVQAQEYIAGPPPKIAAKDKSSKGITITPYYGFNFEETFEIDGGSVYLNDGPIFGASIGFLTTPNKEFELTYQRQMTHAYADLYYFIGNSLFESRPDDDIAIDYFMVGFNFLKNQSDKITFYGGLSAGMVVFTPQTYNVEAAEKFAVALKGGVRLHLTKNIGIRIQPQLYMPIQSLGANVFVGSGGSGVGVSGYSTITQFGGIGGLSLTF